MRLQSVTFRRRGRGHKDSCLKFEQLSLHLCVVSKSSYEKQAKSDRWYERVIYLNSTVKAMKFKCIHLSTFLDQSVNNRTRKTRNLICCVTQYKLNLCR